MPPAEVIAMDRARARRQTQVTTHGADEVNAVFREIDACTEAVPWLDDELAKAFQNRDDMVLRSRSGNLVTVAPSASLLGFRNLCRRVLRAKGLRVFVDPTPAPAPETARLVEQLMEEHGMDARLYEVARGLGLPLPGHTHPMGQGLGPL